MKSRLLPALIVAVAVIVCAAIHIRSRAGIQKTYPKSADVQTESESAAHSNSESAHPESAEKFNPSSERTDAASPQKADPKSERVILDVPVVTQKPGLYNGCEVSSLDMLLRYKGIDTDKMTLAKQIKKDAAPIVRNSSGKIVSWGDPEKGFVGDITGKKIGYGVYDKPLLALLETYMPGRGANLTGEDIDDLFESVKNGNPVVVWVTCNFNEPSDFVTWKSGEKKIKATFSEHAVLLVGYDEERCYVNNPLSGEKKEKVDRSAFEKVWKSMGSMAITCS